MLRDPELRDAFENLKSLPVNHAYSEDTKILLVNLRSTTLLLLRAVDNIGARYARDLHEVRELLHDNARSIQNALDMLRRN